MHQSPPVSNPISLMLGLDSESGVYHLKLTLSPFIPTNICFGSVWQSIGSFSNPAAVSCFSDPAVVVCRQHAVVDRQLQQSSSGGVSAACGSLSAGCSGSVIDCSVPAVAIQYNSSGRNCDTWRWMCNTNLHTASYSQEIPNWVLKPI